MFWYGRLDENDTIAEIVQSDVRIEDGVHTFLSAEPDFDGSSYIGRSWPRPRIPRYYTLKSRVWDEGRISDEDFDALDDAVNSLSRRLRNQWRDSIYLYHDEEPYLTVRASLERVLSEEKIDRVFQMDGFE